MKSKKLLTKIAAVMLVCTMMTACAAKPADDKKDPANDTTPSTTQGADGREKVGIMYKEGLPIVDPGTYTFTMFIDGEFDVSKSFLFEELEKQTGVKVEFIGYPYEIAKEKHALALGSGDYADSIGGWIIKEDEVLIQGVNEGVYVPLDQYFADYCPKLTEILEIEGVRDTMTTPDGHIYSIPYVMEAPEVAYQPFVNTTWLKNVGMEMPKTTEEFKTLLKAFKEKDANGNGDTKDEVPFVLRPDNNQIGATFGWFGLSVDDNGFAMDGDQLVFGANREEFKQGIKYLADLYAEGLIDQEIFTQDKALWLAKGAKDTYGVCGMYGSGDILPYPAGTVPNWEALPVLSSPECDKPVYLRSTYGTDVLKSQVVVTDKAKNPEVIARWWDNFFQLDNVLQSQHGPLDVTLFKTEDGEYKKIDITTMSEEEQKLYDWGNLYPQSLPKYVPNGFRILEDPKPYEEKPPADELYRPFMAERIPTYWAPADKAKRMADIQVSIKDYILQKRAEWISGQADVDKEWDAYVKQLEKLNVQELLDLRLEALN